MHVLGPEEAHLLGLRVAELIYHTGTLHYPRVRGKDPVDVGPDPYLIRGDGVGKKCGGVIRTPSSERRHLPGCRASDETSDYGNDTLRQEGKQLLPHPLPRLGYVRARFPERVVGDDTSVSPRKRLDGDSGLPKSRRDDDE